MKKFLATAAFITAAAITNMLNAQSEPRLMDDQEAKERVELSDRENFLEAIDNGDGSATVILVGQDPHWNMPGDPRSELRIRIEDTNNDNRFTVHDKASHFHVVALQKTDRNRNSEAEKGFSFNAFPLNKTAILDLKYHENMIINHNNVATDGDAVNKQDTKQRRRSKKAFSKAFTSEANFIAVTQDTFGVLVAEHIWNVRLPRNDMN